MRVGILISLWKSYQEILTHVSLLLRQNGFEVIFFDFDDSLLGTSNKYIAQGNFYLNISRLIDNGANKRINDTERSFSPLESLNYKGYDISKAIYYDKMKHYQTYRNHSKSRTKHTRLITNIEATEAFIEKFSIDVVIILNGFSNLKQISIRTVCESRNFPLYYLEKGFVPNSYVWDTKGINRSSEIAGERWDYRKPLFDEVEKNQDIINQYIDSYKKKGETLHTRVQQNITKSITEELCIKEGQKVMLFPCQVDVDTNIIFHAPVIRSQPIIIKKLLMCIEKDFPDHILVVKTHPQDIILPCDFDDIVHNQLRVVDKVDLHALIRRSDIVITINSNVGFESLALGKPVVALGRSLYSEKGFTYDLEKIEDLPKLLRKAQNHGMTNEMTNKYHGFIYYILRYYLMFKKEELFEGSNKEKIIKLVETIKNSTGKTHKDSHPEEVQLKKQFELQNRYKKSTSDYQLWKKSLQGAKGKIIILPGSQKPIIRKIVTGYEQTIVPEDYINHLKIECGYSGRVTIKKIKGVHLATSFFFFLGIVTMPRISNLIFFLLNIKGVIVFTDRPGTLNKLKITIRSKCFIVDQFFEVVPL